MFPQAHDRLATIGAAASVTDAAEVTFRLYADFVVVCNETGSLVGMITKNGIVSQIGRFGAGGCTASVDTTMPREVFSCLANERLQDVCTAIKQRGLQRIPVLGGDGKPIGTLYSRDVLQSLLSEVEDEEALLRDDVLNVGYR